MESTPFPNQNRLSLDDRSQLSEDHVGLYLPLIEDLFLPHLGP